VGVWKSRTDAVGEAIELTILPTRLQLKDWRVYAVLYEAPGSVTLRISPSLPIAPGEEFEVKFRTTDQIEIGRHRFSRQDCHHPPDGLAARCCELPRASWVKLAPTPAR
jgi:hypothetical protein